MVIIMQNKLKDNSVGIVLPKTVEIKHGLQLDCGNNLENFSLIYETYGEFNSKKDKEIIMCHALSGVPHAAGYHSVDDK